MWLFPLPVWMGRRVLSRRNVCGRNLSSYPLWMQGRPGPPPCHQEFLPTKFPRVQKAGLGLFGKINKETAPPSWGNQETSHTNNLRRRIRGPG